MSEPATLLTAWTALLNAAPEARALIEAATGHIHTRRDLDSRATALAEKLAEKGSNLNVCGPSLAGSWVTFSRVNGPAWFEAFLALLKLGAVPIPLDPSESPAAQLALAQAIRAHFVLADTGELIALPSTRRPSRADACLVKLTSGSTGTPRALVFTHAQMLADGRQVCSSMDVRADDLNLALIPFGHSYGLGNLVIPFLAQGTPLLCASAPLHHALAADAIRWQPTIFPAVPTILRVLAATDVPADSLQSLRVIISAGSPLSPEIAQAFFNKFNRHIHSFYGSSETGGICYDRTGDATLTGRSVGTPLGGVTLHISRTHRFTVTSPAVFTTGNRRRSTASLGTHTPADLAKLDPSTGELTLLGRTGRMVKIASRRLDLTALEQEARRLAGIRDAFFAPHPSRPEELACALATDLTTAEARALLHTALAAWKMPKRLIVLKEFPLTPRGKPDTKALRAILS